ncbi:hypothetical protein PoB_000628200 [Plakobranchus ocellatus]|uniref:Uncharacterized protein n=1 Tax=Plakobranchus ocellatus TaxID=259542 RepID=A0AAV3YCE6_9GAST|nr:hypothetical protein PoB_000628200 [Plakobranchus ocellatus]
MASTFRLGWRMRMKQLSCSLVSVLIVATAIVITAGIIIITRRQRTILAPPALNLNRRIHRNQGPRLSLQNPPMVQSQPLPSDRPAQTQSHSVSSQEPPVQLTNSAMAPHQPLRSQPHQPGSAQTQSQPTNPQNHQFSLLTQPIKVKPWRNINH